VVPFVPTGKVELAWRTVDGEDGKRELQVTAGDVTRVTLP